MLGSSGAFRSSSCALLVSGRPWSMLCGAGRVKSCATLGRASRSWSWVRGCRPRGSCYRRLRPDQAGTESTKSTRERCIEGCLRVGCRESGRGASICRSSGLERACVDVARFVLVFGSHSSSSRAPALAVGLAGCGWWVGGPRVLRVLGLLRVFLHHGTDEAHKAETGWGEPSCLPLALHDCSPLVTWPSGFLPSGSDACSVAGFVGRLVVVGARRASFGVGGLVL